MRPIKVEAIPRVANDVPPHDHEFYEVVLVRSGKARHQTVSGERDLGAGDLLILAPGQVHGIRNTHGLKVFNVYYLSEWVLQDLPLRNEAPTLCLLFLGQNLFPDKTASEPVHVRLSPDCAELVDGELTFLDALSRQANPNTVLMRASLVKTFAILADALAQALELEHQFLSHAVVQHAMACIDRALADGEPCNVAAWAEKMNYTPDYFSRRFREQTGESPTTFFQRRRLQRAAHSLIRGSESIGEIAHRLGFTDNAHFCRMFRAHFQMAPRAYRQRFHV